MEKVQGKEGLEANASGTSLVAQRLRLRLLEQDAQVQSLVGS